MKSQNSMKTCIAVLALLMMPGILAAQRKKEQIEILTQKVDSLSAVLERERTAWVSDERGLRSTIDSLGLVLKGVQQDFEDCKVEKEDISAQLEQKKEEVETLESQYASAVDSINALTIRIADLEKELNAATAVVFKEVTIGNQVWMAENLNVDKFRNGDPIPEAKTDEEWWAAVKNKQPAWCYYDNDPANGEKYGKLYNWYAVNDPRGLAPEGWHVPSDEEWTGLTDYLGGNDVAAGKMKSTSGWVDYNGNPANGTNSSGFSGLPGGSRSMISAAYGGNSFGGIGGSSRWWSSSDFDYGAYSRGLGAAVEFVTPCGADCGKERGLYVRCVRD